MAELLKHGDRKSGHGKRVPPFPCIQNGSPTIERPRMELYLRHGVRAGNLNCRDERLGPTDKDRLFSERRVLALRERGD